MLLLSLFLNLYCCKLLIEVHDKTGGSLPDIGFAAYGKVGKTICNILLITSQFGFCTAYVYFIASQLGGEGGVIQCATSHNGDENDCSDGSITDKWWWLLICLGYFLPLIYVRKVEKFSITHIFSDVLIMISILVLCIYAGVDVSNRGGFATECILPISPTFWPSAIGFSMYAFEGIGVILPIREITEKKEDYLKIFILVVGSIGIFYVVFCEFMIFGFGADKVEYVFVTESLPRKSVVTYGIKVLFCIMLLFTYPL